VGASEAVGLCGGRPRGPRWLLECVSPLPVVVGQSPTGVGLSVDLLLADVDVDGRCSWTWSLPSRTRSTGTVSVVTVGCSSRQPDLMLGPGQVRSPHGGVSVLIRDRLALDPRLLPGDWDGDLLLLGRRVLAQPGPARGTGLGASCTRSSERVIASSVVRPPLSYPSARGCVS
jgi:hypothetical protein